MSMNVKPLGGYVVAVVEEVPTKTASGLYLPANPTEKSKVAKVVAVGPSVKQVKVGNRILYKSYYPPEVKVGGTEYLLVEEKDILATLKESEEK